MIQLTLIDGYKVEVDPICIRKVYRNENTKHTDIKFRKVFDQIKEPEKISVKESCKFIRLKIKNYLTEYQYFIFDEC